MIELLGEHTLQIFREFKSRWQEFEQMDQQDKLKVEHKRNSPAVYGKAIILKRKSYLEKLKKEKELKAQSELNENTLNPQESAL